MDMQINSRLIRELRKKRGWTQEQLAKVSALGQRTVHRIENEGIASAESIMAIAAALSVSVEELLVSGKEETQAPKKDKGHYASELLLRLALAAVSGLLVPVVLQWTVFLGGYPGFPLKNELGEFFAGMMFALFVAYPFLPRDRMFSLRALGLLVSCGFSFVAAIFALSYGMDKIFGENVESFLLASVTGSLTVLLAVRVFAGIKFALLTWILAVVTSLFSGAYMFLAIHVLSDYQFVTLASIIGFSLWHCVMALILFHGAQHSGQGRQGETILDPLLELLLLALGPRLKKIADFLLTRVQPTDPVREFS